ncbi:hypothetical protein [Clavibacter nebraskensis]|uniref:Secreted protein n=3 Tax=Clavibacter TaxID=1573 RepID=A0A399QI43_9MICO|nr:hypothetical protein [Clavibacter nebraskensis]KXU19446.1 hypothetical protein VV38_14550 [Clavibacter nebraskensis]OAH19826.1 hypothetical protein A3Q38_07960 [Clavibacter nebraskensis]QGV65443.1 hypothetical protein EGX36_00290 [Clavibacter nebraskensis]QGV68241.1 hypothetical protein EGX37_00290 [Clavibacter nebraskensis]QGV71034.1 hypothetical protein EGX35_00290 [Clavibacter nebraskensis]
MSHHTAAATKKTTRVRFAPLAIATGVAAAVLLSVSMSGTLSGFVASITNDTNTAASGSLVMQESQAGANGAPTVTCLSTSATSGVDSNAATCSTINKFGGSTAMMPGQTVTSVVSIKNVGTTRASTFTLTPGAACTQIKNGTVNGSATDFCSKLNVVITAAGSATPVYSGTAAALAGSSAKTLTALAANASTDFTFAVTLDSSAGNTYQGLGASLPLTWTFAG